MTRLLDTKNEFLTLTVPMENQHLGKEKYLREAWTKRTWGKSKLYCYVGAKALRIMRMIRFAGIREAEKRDEEQKKRTLQVPNIPITMIVFVKQESTKQRVGMPWNAAAGNKRKWKPYLTPHQIIKLLVLIFFLYPSVEKLHYVVESGRLKHNWCSYIIFIFRIN